jgi:hypothetical protein
LQVKKQLVEFMREAFEDWAGADLQFAKWDGSRAIVAMILARGRFYKKRTCLVFRGGMRSIWMLLLSK